MTTKTLIQAKQLVYLQGIGGQIDTGAWEKLPVDQHLPGFQHIFAWQRSCHFLLGRLWSSSDGKGRTQYLPSGRMCSGPGFAIGFGSCWQVFPNWSGCRKACTATRLAGEVQKIIQQSGTFASASGSILPGSRYSGRMVRCLRPVLFARPEWVAHTGGVVARGAPIPTTIGDLPSDGPP